MRTSVDVHNFLIEREVPHEVFSARGRLRTPERLAAVLDLPQEEVGKVVVFEGPKAAVAAVVPAGTRDAVLYFPGGEVRSVLKIRGSDLVKATRARVASILAGQKPTRPAS